MINVIAHFNDGYYTIINDKWVKCNKDGKVEERKIKMTREEAIQKITSGSMYGHGRVEGVALLCALEALELIKFDEKVKFDENKELVHIFQYGNYGDIVIQHTPEGLILWVGGRIKWKSWERYLTPQEIYNKHIETNPADACVKLFGMTSGEILAAIRKSKND